MLRPLAQSPRRLTSPYGAKIRDNNEDLLKLGKSFKFLQVVNTVVQETVDVLEFFIVYTFKKAYSLTFA